MFEVYCADYVYIVSSTAPRFEGTIYVNGTPQTYDDINWHSWALLELMNVWTSSSEYIPDDSLPNSFPDISVFDMRKSFETRFYEDNTDGYFGIYGDVTYLKVVVPEPTAILLLGSGSLVFLRRCRVTHKHN